MARFGRSFPMPNIGLVLTGYPEELSASILLETESGDQILDQRQVSLGVLTTFESSSATEVIQVISGVSTPSSVGSLGIQIDPPDVTISQVSAFAVQRDIKLVGSIEEASDVWKSGTILNRILRIATNRLKPFPDTIHPGGVDFTPVIDHPAQWRVSTVVRDTIFLSSRASISSDLTKEGKP